jgi:hypothetical protein
VGNVDREKLHNLGLLREIHIESKLWCDLKTDEEKAIFFRCGRAARTGIIAPVLSEEVADVFDYRAKCEKKNLEIDCSIISEGLWSSWKDVWVRLFSFFRN